MGGGGRIRRLSFRPSHTSRRPPDFFGTVKAGRTTREPDERSTTPQASIASRWRAMCREVPLEILGDASSAPASGSSARSKAATSRMTSSTPRSKPESSSDCRASRSSRASEMGASSPSQPRTAGGAALRPPPRRRTPSPAYPSSTSGEPLSSSLSAVRARVGGGGGGDGVFVVVVVVVVGGGGGSGPRSPGLYTTGTIASATRLRCAGNAGDSTTTGARPASAWSPRTAGPTPASPNRDIGRGS